MGFPCWTAGCRGLNGKNEEKLAEKLKSYKDSLSEEEITALIADTRHLKEYQEEPSSREDMEKIPMLKRSDMKKEAAPFYRQKRNMTERKYFFPISFPMVFYT